MFVNTHVHTHFSLLDGLSKPIGLAQRCSELGQKACALTDHGSISGAADFITQCKNYGIKPLIGIEAYVSEDNANIKTKDNKVSHQVILAKNLTGWKKLIQLVSKSNDKENFYYKPRVDINIIREICDDNLISFSGHLGSTLHLRSSSMEDMKNYVGLMKDIFGSENFFLEVQLIDAENSNEMVKQAKRIRELSERTQTPCVATGDAHYARREDADDHRVLLCSSMKTNFREINKKLKQGNCPLESFFTSNNFSIISEDDAKRFGNTDEEINNTNKIADMCEEYDITGPPRLPKFDCPDGMNENEYLRRLCREGWKNKCDNWDDTIYGDRVKKELQVIQEAGLAGYFLIVQDYVKWTKSQGWLVGVARGCLSPDTLIVSDKGKLIPIKDMKIGDCVYSHNGCKNNVTNVFKYQCDENLIEIKTFYGHFNNIKVTKDHKILAQKHQLIDNYHNYSKSTQKNRKKYKDVTDQLEWIEAKDLKQNDWMCIPKIKTSPHKELIIFDLANYCLTNDTRFDNNKVYYEPINVLCQVKMFSREINRKVVLDDDLARILGIFCGDGWLNFRTGNSIGFAFHSDETPNINFVKSFFEKLGCYVYEEQSKQRKLVQLTIRHKVIYHLFTRLFNDYKSSFDKHVPDIIFKASENIRINFIKGYSQADGYITKSKIVFTTISKRLSEEIRYLLLSIGIISSGRVEDRIGNKNIKHISYIITCPCHEKLCGQFSKQINYYREFDNYFLVKIKDIEEVKNKNGVVYDIEIKDTKNYLTSNGIVHNSAAGSLVSHLLDVTDVDPIKYGLIFERFYNASRAGSLPDIDIDFPVHKRKYVVEYIRDKYGHDRVSQMVTFGRLQGKAALKEVLRVHNACSFKESNNMSKDIPQEAEISDQLEDAGEKSIIRWTLNHDPKRIQDFCRIDEQGNFIGEYAEYFKQAIRLEGTHKSQGKHPAGIVLSAEPLDDVCPMIHDKNSSEKIAGMSMEDLESMGHVKFDLLGLAILDKSMTINNLLQNGRID